MFRSVLNHRRISSMLKLLCLLTVIVSTIIILFHQNQEGQDSSSAGPSIRGLWDQISPPAAAESQASRRISSSSSSWARESSRNPSILSPRKVKKQQQGPGSIAAASSATSSKAGGIPFREEGGGRADGDGGEEEDGDLFAPSASERHQQTWNNAVSDGRRIRGPQELFSVNHGIQVESFVDDCGLNHDCPNDHFSIHLFTGFEDKIYPKLCVDGKYILDKGVNGCGRGINVVIIDSTSKSIASVSNFDTYDQDSTSLETFLLQIREDDILILLTFDEPSSKLSQVTRLLLHELGSGKAQNLNYRTSWYLITQKGITGYSPYEEIHFPTYNASQAAKSVWGSPHDVRMCLPLRFEGVAVQAEETIRKNPSRRSFCLKFAHMWPYFCESHVVNEPLIASTVSRIPVSNELFRTPVLLLTRASNMDEFSDLSLTLETLLRQPGIEPKNVIVFYNLTCCPSVRNLVNLFGFMSIPYPEAIAPGDGENNNDEIREPVEGDKVNSRRRQQQMDLLKDSLQTAQLLFPDANQLILMESHLILSPDFLPFFGQMIPLMSNSRETGIHMISAWNENGLLKTSSDARLVFRADASHHGARFAVMINRIASFADWNRRPGDRESLSWSFNDVPTLPLTVTSPEQDIPHVLFPDMSRVSIIVASLEMDQQRSTVEEHSREDVFIRNYLSQARTLNTDEDARILNTDLVINASSYESSVRKVISSQQTYTLDQAISILTSSRKADLPADQQQGNGSTKNMIMVIDAGNGEGWSKGCRFFQLVNCNPHLRVKGIGSVIRFTIPDQIQLFLVRKHPEDGQEVERDQKDTSTHAEAAVSQ